VFVPSCFPIEPGRSSTRDRCSYVAMSQWDRRGQSNADPASGYGSLARCGGLLRTCGSVGVEAFAALFYASDQSGRPSDEDG
jgi:hypothetical protein